MTTVAVAFLWARRSFWLVMSVAGASLAFFYAANSRMVGPPLWVDVGHSLEYAVGFLGPMVAAMTAFHTARQQRRPIRALLDSMPRGETQSALAMIGGQLMWVLSALIPVGLWLFINTAIGAEAGGPDLGPIGAGIAALMASASVGYLIARLAPYSSTPIVVAVLWWVAIWLVGTGETPLRLLSPLIDGEPSPLWPIPFSVGFLQMVWFAGITGVGIVLGSFSRLSTWRSGVFAIVVLVAATSAAVALVGRDPFVSVGAGYEATCAESQRLALCVHPAVGSLAAPGVDVAERVLGPIAAATGWPRRVLQVGLRVDAVEAERSDENTLAFTAPLHAKGGGVADREFAIGLANAVVGSDVCSELPPDDPVRAGLVPWIATTGSPAERAGYLDLKFITRFEQLTVRDQQDWLAQNVPVLHACETVELP